MLLLYESSAPAAMLVEQNNTARQAIRLDKSVFFVACVTLQLQRWPEKRGRTKLSFRSPTSITSTFFSSNTCPYDTIKRTYFQVNYPVGPYNLAFFKAEKCGF